MDQTRPRGSRDSVTPGIESAKKLNDVPGPDMQCAVELEQSSMPGAEEKSRVLPRDAGRRPYMGGWIRSISGAIGRMDRMLTGRKEGKKSCLASPLWGRSRRAAVRS